MIELAQQRSASIGQSIDKRCLPKRSATVITRHEHGPCEIEEIRLTEPGFSQSMEMEPEGKVGVRLPVRWPWWHRPSNPLPEARHSLTDPIETIDNHIPIGGSVKHHECDNRRPQHRVSPE